MPWIEGSEGIKNTGAWWGGNIALGRRGGASASLSALVAESLDEGFSYFSRYRGTVHENSPFINQAGLGTASSGAACKAGFDFLPIVPFRLRPRASITHCAISSSTIPGADASSSMPSSAASSSSSVIVGGFSNGASHGCRNNMAYVGRNFGILLRAPLTKSRAASENFSGGKSGGSPSTIA